MGIARAALTSRKSRHSFWGYAANNYDILDSYDLDPRNKPDIYFKMLYELPTGLTEWAIHPALDTPELKAISDTWPVRQTDFAFLMSPQTREIIRQEGIIVLDYKPLQALWQTKQ